MTDEQFKSLLLPGITLEDFGKPLSEEVIVSLKAATERLRQREKERRRRARQPFRNHYINI